MVTLCPTPTSAPLQLCQDLGGWALVASRAPKHRCLFTIFRLGQTSQVGGWEGEETGENHLSF